MPTYTQDKRPIAVETPLGKDALLLTAFSGQEEMSRLFRYELEMLSDKSDLKAPEIVGKNVTFFVQFPDGQPRHFNGFVQRFAYCGAGDRLSMYRATVVPWFWFLTRTSDCRIFQDKSIPEIIEAVFSDAGFSDFDKSGITQSHPKWEYCVQYRETDFNFVSRLMEHEGIFYYFRHEQGKHTLVMGDGTSAYKDCRDKDVKFDTNLAAYDVSDQLLSWEHQYEFRSGKWVHTDYNFKKPSTNLLSDTKTKIPLPDASKWELFDYPGEYEEKGDGTSEVKLRMEEEEATYDVVQGKSVCRSFNPGGKFKLTQHYNKSEQGKGYVVTGVRHECRIGASYVTGATPEKGVYHNSFTCIPDSVPYRPQRLTPKPIIQGVQTALVVGPSGDEIYTDEYGRIKVQFYWDRLGKKDDKSSCWIRCAQSIAGKGWGAMQIPRIGQEVVVNHLEGDPDRPLVTGVVYNDGQKPPYKLPDEKTKSYLKTNSSKGGSGFNEIRFEDKAGKEQVFLHAQKDMDVRVLNDQREIVLGNKHLIVGSESGGGDLVEKIEKDHWLYIKGDSRETVYKEKFLYVLDNQHEVISGSSYKQIDGDLHQTVMQAKHEKVGMTYSLTAGMDLFQKVGMNYALEAGMAVHIKAGMTMVLEAGVQLSLKVGGNFIDINPAGVAINGMPMTMINSGGAAGSGGGCSPTEPELATTTGYKEPAVADATAKTGQKSAP